MKSLLALVGSPLGGLAAAGAGGGMGAFLAEALQTPAPASVTLGALLLMGIRLDLRVSALEREVRRRG